MRGMLAKVLGWRPREGGAMVTGPVVMTRGGSREQTQCRGASMTGTAGRLWAWGAQPEWGTHDPVRREGVRAQKPLCRGLL